MPGVTRFVTDINRWRGRKGRKTKSSTFSFLLVPLCSSAACQDASPLLKIKTLSAYLLSLDMYAVGEWQEQWEGTQDFKNKQNTKNPQTQDEPKLNLYRFGFNMHASVGWTAKAPNLFSTSSSWGPSSSLIWQLPSPLSQQFCLSILLCVAARRGKVKTIHRSVLDFDRGGCLRLVICHVCPAWMRGRQIKNTFLQ